MHRYFNALIKSGLSKKSLECNYQADLWWWKPFQLQGITKKIPFLFLLWQWTTSKDHFIIFLIHYFRNCWLQLLWLLLCTYYLAHEVFQTPYYTFHPNGRARLDDNYILCRRGMVVPWGWGTMTDTNKLISENSILKGEPHRSMKMSRWKRVVTETNYHIFAIIQVRSGENDLRLWQRWQKEQSQIHEAWRQDERGQREKTPGKHIPKVLSCMVGI